MNNYLAPEFSYDKYLNAYGWEVTKGYFMYEYIDNSLRKLDNTVLPLRVLDFLIWQKNRDVASFLQATDN